MLALPEHLLSDLLKARSSLNFLYLLGWLMLVFLLVLIILVVSLQGCSVYCVLVIHFILSFYISILANTGVKVDIE